MNTVGITGGTGLVGNCLAQKLVDKGYKVVILTRNPAGKNAQKSISYALFDYENKKCDATALAQLDGIVHLAGESIAARRWTAAQKVRIAKSRIEGTRFLVTMLQAHGHRCKTLVAASAIGYYGEDATPPLPFTEDAQPGNGFLPETCIQWENEINKAQSFVRTVIVRSGIVFSTRGGALPELIKSARIRVLPVPGNGRQIVSWIHIDDIASLFLYALEQQSMQGAYNGVAPQPASYNVLMDAIARAKGGFFIKPHIPAIFLKAILGEMSIEILKSCTVVPKHTLASGFKFTYPDVGSAVGNLLG